MLASVQMLLQKANKLERQEVPISLAEQWRLHQTLTVACAWDPDFGGVQLVPHVLIKGPPRNIGWEWSLSRLPKKEF